MWIDEGVMERTREELQSFPRCYHLASWVGGRCCQAHSGWWPATPLGTPALPQPSYPSRTPWRGPHLPVTSEMHL